jgi:uncharacterized protein (DUF305 family)
MLIGVDMTPFLADRHGKLRNVNTTIDPDTPANDGHRGRDDLIDPADELDDDDIVVLPWHRNPVNMVAIAIALVLLAGSLGFVLGNNQAIANANDTDVGFLQDMRVHHEQAVQISFIFRDATDRDRRLDTIATDIIVGQNIEIGRMIQLLREFGKPEVNDSDLVMGWMGMAMSLGDMPGLATEDELIALAQADGAEADRIFVELMTAHHEGGIHMADYAADHAGTEEVRLMAAQMAEGQRHEIAEMAGLLPPSAD